ncbi:MAG: hypothetical protein QMD14_02885 [Candidatus Aenigmarchaeota archaeon]|nr:hypothetical protein [Candidatus Aenigmarchaeota archaeon]
MVRLIGLREESLGCPDYRKRETLERIRDYVKINHRLPPPCDECYSVIIYPAKKEENIDKFSRMLWDTFDAVDRDKKYERIYFRGRGMEDKDNFISYLKKKLEEYEADGRVEWRRCCKKLGKEFPHLFKDAKTFAESPQLRMEDLFRV